MLSTADRVDDLNSGGLSHLLHTSVFYSLSVFLFFPAGLSICGLVVMWVRFLVVEEIGFAIWTVIPEQTKALRSYSVQ